MNDTGTFTIELHSDPIPQIVLLDRMKRRNHIESSEFRSVIFSTLTDGGEQIVCGCEGLDRMEESHRGESFNIIVLGGSVCVGGVGCLQRPPCSFESHFSQLDVFTDNFDSEYSSI